MELWDVYDKRGCKTGKTKQRGSLLISGEFHLAMEIWIVNEEKQLLIQRRAQSKKILPDIWGMTTGCIVAGEDSVSGCIREVQEEIGISLTADDIIFLQRIFRTNTIWDVYVAHKNADLAQLVLQQEEVSEVKWITFDELREMLKDGQFFAYPEIDEIITLVEQFIRT